MRTKRLTQFAEAPHPSQHQRHAAQQGRHVFIRSANRSRQAS